MIFGMLNPEKIWPEILQICPPHLSDVATLSWHIQKVTFISIIHTYFWLFMLSQKKTHCKPLAYPTWKCHHTNLWTAKLFLSDWRFVAFFQTLELWREPVVGCHQWLWKEPLVMCGYWNVRQTTSQQVFRVTTFCTNTASSLFRHWSWQGLNFSSVVYYATA